jgi:hypothetical protein
VRLVAPTTENRTVDGWPARPTRRWANARPPALGGALRTHSGGDVTLTLSDLALSDLALSDLALSDLALSDLALSDLVSSIRRDHGFRFRRSVSRASA